jgi:hypothetical protein
MSLTELALICKNLEAFSTEVRDKTAQMYVFMLGRIQNGETHLQRYIEQDARVYRQLAEALEAELKEAMIEGQENFKRRRTSNYVERIMEKDPNLVALAAVYDAKEDGEPYLGEVSDALLLRKEFLTPWTKEKLEETGVSI